MTNLFTAEPALVGGGGGVVIDQVLTEALLECLLIDFPERLGNALASFRGEDAGLQQLSQSHVGAIFR